MYVEDEIFKLRQRVSMLEKRMEVVLKHLDIRIRDSNQSIPDEILELVLKGDRMAAIKLFREMTGASLKASKEMIESIE